MSRWWPGLRLSGGVLVLAALVWRFGSDPFASAWRLTTPGSVVAALLLTAVATVASAWRWRVVSRALGTPLSVGGSIAAYYRSQLLNATLPGGVLGERPVALDGIGQTIEITVPAGPQTAIAIPYFQWDNRDGRPMRVWMPRS